MQLLAASLLAAVALASARPEAPTQQYGAPDSAPYPPSGWRPEGRQFFLPSRSSGQYAPPPQQYGPPPPPPAAPTTTEAAETTTTELPTTTAASDVRGDGARAFAQSEAFGAGAQNGVYYLLQPDGRLQRVAYAHGPAPAAYTQTRGAAPVADAGYLARFHYQDLPPPGAPVYAYSAPKLVRLS